MVRISDAPVMVIEGDEYLSSPIDRRPKFHLYQANIGVISGVAWDHVNVFPTFENYVSQFDTFINTITPGGTLIYCQQDEVLCQVVANNKHDITRIPYTTAQHQIADGVTTVVVDGQYLPLQVFGQHNLLNAQAACLVCKALGISEVAFYTHLGSFKGAARRLELLGKNKQCNIYKDFAHSPSKLKATIGAVNAQFSNRALVALIELHTFSSLNEAFLAEYAHTMDEATTAIVFIDNKTFEQKKMQPYPPEVVKKAFERDDLRVYNDAEVLRADLEKLDLQNSNLLLMSSGNFGGIDINQLAKNMLNRMQSV